MQPITKQESRQRNDRQASASLYRRRRIIDQRLSDRQLERQLKEVWE
ncbi:hypothetical protein ACFQH5_15810 [Halomonas salifodinae]|uniref:Uncharacterized protein n=2 Tax=Halomonadaceae TaxID=28256 RepID=A0A510XCM9_9GAMM|nr:hypothetical protein [Halomonas pacifica]MBH8578759.1 hypothetical protein [Halomonas pacifica]GEK49204.1 hypothetical protein HPA02_34870 [Halomonas pacifica]